MALINVDELFQKISACKHVVAYGTLQMKLEDVIHCVESCKVIGNDGVAHAKWNPSWSSEFLHECSNCGGECLEVFKYCPNCGAIMDLEDE